MNTLPTQPNINPVIVHDVLEWMRDMLRTEWQATTTKKPVIAARHELGKPNTKISDYIVLYYLPAVPELRGSRHRRENQGFAVDIRAISMKTAILIRDEVYRILDLHAVQPDPYGEWGTLQRDTTNYPQDYADYAQVVIDCTLTAYARRRGPQARPL